MPSVAARHEDDLDGRLVAIDRAPSVEVAIKIDADVAQHAAVQHTAWMTLNMLCRLERIVEHVWVICPETVEVAGRINPLATASRMLADALMDGAAFIGVVPAHHVVSAPGAAIVLTIGPGDAVPGGMRVHGEGWWGGVARKGPITSTSRSALPFGPYLAAALAVAEVFKASRVAPDRLAPLARVFYSSWSYAAGTEPDVSGPDDVDDLVLWWTLAGVGAVGAMCLHALWACPGLRGEVFLADGDADGIDTTNLNRYLLFGRSDVGEPKASTAAERLSGHDLVLIGHDDPFETAPVPKVSVLCAVDSNPSRTAVQSAYPEQLLMASTKDLRAELVRCDPRHAGPCARCFNPEAPRPSDEELREKIQRMTDEQRQQVATQVGVSGAEALEWADTGECGVAGERVRDALLPGDDRALFAVPFVSCAAGTMLAAEACKEAIGAVTPLSVGLPRATLQFWDPSAISNRATSYQRDPSCPMCAPGTIATNIWLTRCQAAVSRDDAPAS